MNTIASGSIRSLTCPNCGAAIVLRGMAWTRVVTCSSCSAMLDASDPNLRILQEFSERARVEPAIPLGARGQWRGALYEVIGFQVVSITVEGTRYAWREYLLFNPYHGFRYLTEYDGHWNDVVSVRSAPRVEGPASQPTASYQGHPYKHFQTASATTEFILGEFPWEVRVGDVVTASDYVDPPRILSSESADAEVNWSLGEYVDGGEIWRAFKLKGAPPPVRGVFANQPNPHAETGGVWKLFGKFAMVLLALMIIRQATADKQVVHSAGYVFGTPDSTVSAVATPSFDLGGTGNVAVDVETNLDNSWVMLTFTLIEENTGAAYDFGREVGYYSGTDSDGRWTEGSPSAQARVAAIPAGHYFLRIESERPPGTTPVRATVKVQRDLPSFSPYLIALGLLFVPPLFLAIRRGSFEAQRWAESDHAPASSEDDDE